MKRTKKEKRILAKRKLALILSVILALSFSGWDKHKKTISVIKDYGLFNDDEDFIKSLESFHVNFKYSDAYKAIDFVDRLFINPETTHKSYDTDILEYTSFKDNTDENNEKFLKSILLSEFSGVYEVPEKNITEYVTKINDNLNEDINEKLEIERVPSETLECVLNEFKIFYSSNLPPGAIACVIPDQYAMLLNDSKTQYFADILGISYEESLDIILNHETNHLLQLSCKCIKNKEQYLSQKVGICKVYEWDQIDMLWWSWYLESSTEELADKKIAYFLERKYLNLMEFILSIDSDYENGLFHKLVYYHDPEPLKEMFNLKSTEDAVEFINMMYSIELLTVKPDNIIKYLSEKYKEKSIHNLEGNSSLDVMKTMTKYFFYNLSNETKKGNLSIKDNTDLIAQFENHLNGILNFESTKYHFSDSLFYEFYNLVRKEYYEFMNTTFEEEVNVDILLNPKHNTESTCKKENQIYINPLYISETIDIYSGKGKKKAKKHL